MNTLLTLNSVVQDDLRAVGKELASTLAPLPGSTMLITGGNGFLCSYFLETIACPNDTAWHSPCRVITADNLRSGVAERVAHLAGRPADLTNLRERFSWNPTVSLAEGLRRTLDSYRESACASQ